MRFYLVNEDKEIVLDLVNVKREASGAYGFEFFHMQGTLKLNVFIRELAGKYFYSHDGNSWLKIANVNGCLKQLVYFNQNFVVHRGYKPSSVTRSDEGALFTKMPGKVVKILYGEGSPVKKGWPLIIIEAMKMENEIKSNKDGRIKVIHIKEGQALDQGVLLMEIED